MKVARRPVIARPGAREGLGESASWSRQAAERSIAVTLAMESGLSLVFAPLQTWTVRAQHPHPFVVVVVAAALAASTLRAVWVARAAEPPAPGRLDVAVCLALLVPAGAIELFAQPAGISQGQASSSTAALTMTAYFAPRVPGPWTWAIPALAAAAHAVAIRSYPGAAVQGVPMILGVCVASAVVARVLRRVGRDADVAAAAAAAAERAEGCARVHDAQGLLRMAARWEGDREDVADAVRHTEQGVSAWLTTDPTGRPPSPDERLAQVVADFPDLDVAVELDAWPRGCDPMEADVAAAVARAVHTLLTNVRQHCGEAPVRICGRLDSARWTLAVEDQGDGFDPHRMRRGRGLGRYCLDDLAALDVEVDLDARPGRGTRVALSGRRADAEPGGTTGPGAERWAARRFDAWRSRPEHGRARIVWITDVARSGVLAMLWAMELTGLPTTLSQPHGEVAAVAALAGMLVVSLHWVLSADPRVRSTLAVGTTAVVLGALATWAIGPAALDGSKLGMVTAAWTCFYVSTVRSVPTAWLVGLGLLHLLAAVPDRPADGLLAGVFMVAGPLVAASVVRALHDLGRRWNDEVARRAVAERRTAAAVLRRQLRAATRAGDSLDAVLQDAAAWLDRADGPAPRQSPEALDVVRRSFDRLAGGRATVDLRDMRCVPTAAQTRAVEAALAGLLRSGAAAPARIDVRGTGDDARWRLAVLVDDLGDGGDASGRAGLADEARRLLEGAGIAVSVTVVGPGAQRLVLRAEVAP